MQTLDSIKKIYTLIKFKHKFNKLKISKGMQEYLIERLDIKEVIDILEIIQKSKNEEQFKMYIIDYCKNNKHIYSTTYFLLGLITGNYSFFGMCKIDCTNFDFDNFMQNNIKELLVTLKDNFYYYVLNDNALKNKFLIDEKGTYNYTLELNREKCNEIFDNVVNGKDLNSSGKYEVCYEVARDYIVKLIGIYGTENICENFDFILYDLNSDKKGTLAERKKEFLQFKKLTEEQKRKIENLDKLVTKLKTINSPLAHELIENIKSLESDKAQEISQIEDIYLQYEILLRKDIISHLFIPSKNYTLVEDFRELKPQLIHNFF